MKIQDNDEEDLGYRHTGLIGTAGVNGDGNDEDDRV